MTKLIICRGLPASGKSTWASEYCVQHPEFKIVNRDTMRLAIIGDQIWNRDREKEVIKERDRLIFDYLVNGVSVISDDTNLSEKTFNHLKQLGESADIDYIETMDFRDVPLEVCIQRDSKRKNKVGKDVILNMYYQYIFKPDVPLAYNKGLIDCVIIDLDGTLSLIPNGKNPYDRDFENDIVNEKVLYLIDHLPAMPIFVSGRKEKYRQQTIKFLREECNLVNNYPLFMRGDDDNRPDHVYKKEIFDNYIKYNYNVLFVIDDRKQMKRMWVERGLFVFDVNQFDEEF